jgi:hypothetical protein
MCNNNPDEIQNIPKYMHLHSKMIKKKDPKSIIIFQKERKEKMKRRIRARGILKIINYM